MKHYPLQKVIVAMLVVLLSGFTASAQNKRPREVQLRTGFGFAAYRTLGETVYKYNNSTETDRDTSGAVCRYTPLDLRFELNHRWSIGPEFKFGRYLYGTLDSTSNITYRANHFTIVGIGAEFAIVSRPGFRWYTGLGINTAGLFIEEEQQNGTRRDRFSLMMRGGGFRLNTGIIAFFGKLPLGFQYQMGYDSHNFNLKAFSINYTNGNLQNISSTLRTAGIDLHFGLVLRVGQKSPYLRFDPTE